MWIQASAAAEKAAKSIADIKISEESESQKEEEETEKPAAEKESDDEDEKRRKSALDKLEKASEESFLGQASFKLCFHILILKFVILSHLDMLTLFFVVWVAAFLCF